MGGSTVIVIASQYRSLDSAPQLLRASDVPAFGRIGRR